MSLLSPGVEVREIDLSLVPTTAGSSFACYAGNFEKGPSDAAVLISSTQQFIDVFGKPTNTNYNDWFQVYSFLSYSNTIYVCRLLDKTGATNVTLVPNATSVGSVPVGSVSIELNSTVGLFKNCNVIFGSTSTNIYTVEEVLGNDITISTPIQTGDELVTGEQIYLATPSYNSTVEVEKTGGVAITTEDLKKTLYTIANSDMYTVNEMSIPFTSASNSKLKFMAKNPGIWGDRIKIAVAVKADFGTGAEAFPGVLLDNAFQYTPENDEVAIVISYDDIIVEQYIVSMTPAAKDYNNKSIYIEDVINRQSVYIYAKDNTSVSGMPASKLNTSALSLVLGSDGAPGRDEVITAYDEHFGNKEEIDIDIVIINETANLELSSFCVKRADVIGFSGATYDQTVGLKSEQSVKNLKDYLTTGIYNIDNKYVSFIGNYGYIYDKYSDKYRWINLAGHAAGLRAYTNNARNYWFASAGYNMGQLRDITKLAFNANQGQRDLLYKNNINCVCSFAGQGIVLWGQKTMSRKASAFDRVNVRMLFNYLERSISRMSKYVVFEQNDTTTRNMFVSMVKPLFDLVKAGRGITDYAIVCNESNNTPLVVANNQFVATFLIKPTYVVEFITLNFVAVGPTISFTEAAGAV